MNVTDTPPAFISEILGWLIFAGLPLLGALIYSKVRGL